MQIVVDEAELARYQGFAAASGLNLSEWVRRALRDAAGTRSPIPPERRLEVIRAALEVNGEDTPGIEQMLAEIEDGYLSGPAP
jgi:hypothetical protein